MDLVTHCRPRARRVLTLLNDVPMRTTRGLMPFWLSTDDVCKVDLLTPGCFMTKHPPTTVSE